VCEHVASGNVKAAQFVTGGQSQAQTAEILRAISESPSLGASGRRPPGRQEFLAPLAQLLQQIRQQWARPVQGPSNPAMQLLLVRNPIGQRLQRQALGHKSPHGGQDLAKTGRFVGHMRAGAEG
jgi:hypothetical protein